MTQRSETDRLLFEISQFVKVMHRMKVALTKEVPDRAAFNLLFPLLEQDLRASDLADEVHSDPSTVSRHIAYLVDEKLVKRVADQHDGRASLVALTPKGRDLCASIKQQRDAAFAHALKGWTAQDKKQFANYIKRLTEGMEENFQEMLDGFRNAIDSPKPRKRT